MTIGTQEIPKWKCQYDYGTQEIPKWKCQYDYGTQEIPKWKCQYDYGTQEIQKWKCQYDYWDSGDPKMEVSLKVGCSLYAVVKQPTIPLINLGRKWTLKR